MDKQELFGKYGMTEAAGKPSGEQIKRVKGMGFLRDIRQDDTFNARVITGNGRVTAAEMEAIVEAARLYGDGHLAMTTRQTVEIGAVKYENIPALLEFLGERGLEVGGTGPRVRPIVSCKGTTCVFGLIDTYAVSREIHERFYRGWHTVTLPHKFKIAVGGCPNSCVKPDLNDIGVIGTSSVSVDEVACRRCGRCSVSVSCPMGAASSDATGLVSLDRDICNGCTRCVKLCPFGAMVEGAHGYRLTVGGRWGKRRAVGQELGITITGEEALYAAIEACLIFYRDRGISGERFADTIAREGLDALRQAVSAAISAL